MQHHGNSRLLMLNSTFDMLSISKQRKRIFGLTPPKVTLKGNNQEISKKISESAEDVT